MGFIGKIIILSVVLLFAVIGYVCCLIAASSDKQAEKIYQDYLNYKSKKGDEQNE